MKAFIQFIKDNSFILTAIIVPIYVFLYKLIIGLVKKLGRVRQHKKNLSVSLAAVSDKSKVYYYSHIDNIKINDNLLPSMRIDYGKDASFKKKKNKIEIEEDGYIEYCTFENLLEQKAFRTFLVSGSPQSSKTTLIKRLYKKFITCNAFTVLYIKHSTQTTINECLASYNISAEHFKDKYNKKTLLLLLDDVNNTSVINALIAEMSQLIYSNTKIILVISTHEKNKITDIASKLCKVSIMPLHHQKVYAYLQQKSFGSISPVINDLLLKPMFLNLYETDSTNCFSILLRFFKENCQDRIKECPDEIKEVFHLDDDNSEAASDFAAEKYLRCIYAFLTEFTQGQFLTEYYFSQEAYQNSSFARQMESEFTAIFEREKTGIAFKDGEAYRIAADIIAFLLNINVLVKSGYNHYKFSQEVFHEYFTSLRYLRRLMDVAENKDVCDFLSQDLPKFFYAHLHECTPGYLSKVFCITAGKYDFWQENTNMLIQIKDKLPGKIRDGCIGCCHEEVCISFMKLTQNCAAEQKIGLDNVDLSAYSFKGHIFGTGLFKEKPETFSGAYVSLKTFFGDGKNARRTLHSDRGDYTVFVDYDNKLRQSLGESYKQLRKSKIENEKFVLAYSGNGRLAASAIKHSDSRFYISLILCDKVKDKLILSEFGMIEPFAGFNFSCQSDYLVSVSENNISVWEVADSLKYNSGFMRKGGKFKSAQFSPGGDRIAVISDTAVYEFAFNSELAALTLINEYPCRTKNIYFDLKNNLFDENYKHLNNSDDDKRLAEYFPYAVSIDGGSFACRQNGLSIISKDENKGLLLQLSHDRAGILEYISDAKFAVFDDGVLYLYEKSLNSADYNILKIAIDKNVKQIIYSKPFDKFFCNDEKIIALTDNEILLIDKNNCGFEILAQDTPQFISCIFDYSGTDLIALTEGGENLFVYNISDNAATLARTRSLERGGVQSVALDNDCNLYTTSDLDYSVKKYSKDKNGEYVCKRIYFGHTNAINFVKVYEYKNNRIIVSASDDGSVKLWDDKKCIATLPYFRKSTKYASFDKDMKYLTAACYDGNVYVFKNVSTSDSFPECISHWRLLYPSDTDPACDHSDLSKIKNRFYESPGLSKRNFWINSSDFSQGEELMITTACWDGYPRIYSFKNEKLKLILKGRKKIPHCNGLKQSIFSPCGKYFATASRDGSIRFYDIKGQPLKGAKHFIIEDENYEKGFKLSTRQFTNNPSHCAYSDLDKPNEHEKCRECKLVSAQFFAVIDTRKTPGQKNMKGIRTIAFCQADGDVYLASCNWNGDIFLYLIDFDKRKARLIHKEQINTSNTNVRFVDLKYKNGKFVIASASDDGGSSIIYTLDKAGIIKDKSIIENTAHLYVVGCDFKKTKFVGSTKEVALLKNILYKNGAVIE